jgi:photosystem II stability/assembly factor-like uncharacterized protein
MKTYNPALLLLLLFSFTSNESLKFLASPTRYSVQTQKRDKAAITNIVFRSVDAGQTWQDISEGLPEKLVEDGLWLDDFFADNNGLHLRVGDIGIYHSQPNATVPFWKKETSPQKQGSLAPGKTGMFAFNYEGQFFQEVKGTNMWLPTFMNFPSYGVRSIFQTAKGNMFIGSERGLHKLTNNGKTWKQVHSGGWVIKMVESNGVLLATSQDGIIRSTDDGEHWELVISEGGVGIDVERIDGGFAAISFNTESQTRRVRTSYDDGKTWQPIDAGLPPSLSISSIIQVGDDLFCGHPEGIYRSPDKGKTWTLLFPSKDGKVFNLVTWGSVIYAIPLGAGC